MGYLVESFAIGSFSAHGQHGAAVIPAKAGIQEGQQWTPAFAGMTGISDF
jgi:hypothetical protein